MISRGIEMQHYGPLSLDDTQNVTFNRVVQKWPASVSGFTFTYSGGVFTIPRASESKYLITWAICVKTSLTYYQVSSNFGIYIVYSGGEFEAGGNSGCPCRTGITRGERLLCVTKKSRADLLTFCIRNYNFGTAYLCTPATALPNPLNETDAVNACISVISI